MSVGDRRTSYGRSFRRSPGSAVRCGDAVRGRRVRARATAGRDARPAHRAAAVEQAVAAEDDDGLRRLIRRRRKRQVRSSGSQQQTARPPASPAPADRASRTMPGCGRTAGGGARSAARSGRRTAAIPVAPAGRPPLSLNSTRLGLPARPRPRLAGRVQPVEHLAESVAQAHWLGQSEDPARRGRASQSNGGSRPRAAVRGARRAACRRVRRWSAPGPAPKSRCRCRR